MNLSHTLASNETKQPASILSEKNLLQQKLNILHLQQKKTRNRKKLDDTETKRRKRKMKPDNLRKTDGSE